MLYRVSRVLWFLVGLYIFILFFSGGGGNVGAYALMVVLTESDRPLNAHERQNNTYL